VVKRGKRKSVFKKKKKEKGVETPFLARDRRSSSFYFI